MLDGDAGSSAGAPVRAPAADPDLLLRVQFGPSVRDSIRRRIVRYAKRLLRQDDAHAPEERRASAHRRHYADRHGRKRRRASSASDESEDYATGRGGRRSDIDCAQGYEQTIALYSRAAGFDLDAARGDASDLDVRYEHGTLAVVGLTADSRQALGNPCFNCAMPGHELRDCPMPVDEDRTDANRRAFREKGPGQFSGRLYLAVEDEKRAGEMRERLRPGLPLSAELCEALGLKSSDEVPAYINNMYMYGYPPAYLGHDVVQDVLQTRSVATLQPPPTPTLHIYHDADDFDRAHAAPSDECSDRGDSTAHDKGAEAKIQTPTKGDDVESDEEGAVSESELAAETNGTVGDGPAPTRNIPLVHYTGLDLKQFDFDSTERPGRPI
ncbi:Zinc finger CCHC domain-containing protein 8, partial [Coemansia nantahalensis]